MVLWGKHKADKVCSPGESPDIEPEKQVGRHPSLRQMGPKHNHATEEPDEKDLVVKLRAAIAHAGVDVEGVHALQAHYPERLHRLIGIHIPYIFWGLWSIVKPLVDKRTRAKVSACNGKGMPVEHHTFLRFLCCCPWGQIMFLEDADMARVLSEEVPKCMLAKCLGGEAELVGHWEKFVEGKEEGKYDPQPATSFPR